MKLSIHARLIVAASVLLILFLGTTAWVLDQALQQRLSLSLKNELQAQLYGFLSAMDETKQGQLKISDSLFDPRFSQPDSGFYAQLASHKKIWQSNSLLGKDLNFVQSGKTGSWRYQTTASILSLNLSFAWQQLDGQEVNYTLAVAQSLEPMKQAQYAFRHTLLFWLGGLVVVLLLVQWLLLFWGLSPLREVAEKLSAIKQGKEKQLTGFYPKELQDLTHNINALIEHNHSLQTRYKESLANLAHSLKTPLAVLQSLAEGDDAEVLHKELKIQLPAMNQLITYQLKKARSQAVSNPITRVDTKQVIERIVNSLQKVYRNKHMTCHLALSNTVYFQGDESDWMEIAGNVLDNAFKYGKSQISVSLSAQDSGFTLVVEDDGNGIDAADYDNILHRGVRLDEQVQGQGIGLSVVNQLLESYRGKLSLSTSDLGGLKVTLYMKKYLRDLF